MSDPHDRVSDDFASFSPPYPSWTKSEEDQLLALVISDQEAPQIPGRTPRACENHWNEYMKEDYPGITYPKRASKPHKRKWILKEEEIVADLLNQGKSWAKIAEELPGRSMDSCKSHFHKYMQKKNPDAAFPDRLAESQTSHGGKDEGHPHIQNWRQEEDDSLVALLKEGHSWGNISQALPGRSVEVCQDRWRDFLCTIHPLLHYDQQQRSPFLDEWTPNENEENIAMHMAG